MEKVCILSGLVIPAGKESIEHYLPKSRVPMCMWNRPENKFYAHYMLNAVKGNHLPCEWKEMKFDLVYKALYNWRIKQDDKDFLHAAIKNWEFYNPNPCEHCLAKCNQKER